MPSHTAAERTKRRAAAVGSARARVPVARAARPGAVARRAAAAPVTRRGPRIAAPTSPRRRRAV